MAAIVHKPGPILQTLTRRLSETPVEFLAEPRIGDAGQVAVAALVNDVLRLHGGRADEVLLNHFHGDSVKADRNRLALVMIAAWLVADEWFACAGLDPAAVCQALAEVAAELAPASAAHKFVNDPDRREELARVVLARLGYRPADETQAQASDRLSAISGTERRRLLEASRDAERRAREIREALAQKAAQESADKWTRE